RSGVFKSIESTDVHDGVAFDTADVNGDGNMDVIALGGDFQIRRVSAKREGGWDNISMAQAAPNVNATSALENHVLVADLDNNGALDLILNDGLKTTVWLNDEKGKWQELEPSPPARVFAVADFNADGRLDLLALKNDGTPQWLINSGTKNYGWLEL